MNDNTELDMPALNRLVQFDVAPYFSPGVAGLLTVWNLSVFSLCVAVDPRCSEGSFFLGTVGLLSLFSALVFAFHFGAALFRRADKKDRARRETAEAHAETTRRINELNEIVKELQSKNQPDE